MTRHRARYRALLLAGAALVTVGAAACNDFLTGGNLSTDPNRPTTVSPTQLFVGVSSNTWAEMTSDPARYSGLWTQQFVGGGIQYDPYYRYQVDENTTNGFHQALYVNGGLPDVRNLEKLTREAGDSLFLGVALVQEAMLMGTGADLFGDLVYTHALKNEQNPPLTPQMEIYDSVQAVLSDAIKCLASKSSKNVGPGSADVNYGGDPASWTALAHTLKARFFLHTAEVRGISAYDSARVHAAKGIQTDAGNYNAVYTGLPLQQNHWYQFVVVNRPGYLIPNPQFVDTLMARSDPRLARYFNSDQSDLAAPLIQPNTTTPIVSATENLLILAESEARLGHDAAAVTALNQEQTIQGVPTTSGSGSTLLRDILGEKYIAMFQNIEVWNDYKRTCYPNLTPVVEGQKITARLFYDTAERQTDTSIPPPEAQPFRNANDPPNATDPFGKACLGQ